MKRKIIYILLSLIIIYQIGKYIYHEHQYQKFEEFFMEARIYGSGKIFLDHTFDKTNQKNGVEDYTYNYFLENKNNKDIFKSFNVTTSFRDGKVIGGGGGEDLDNISKFHIDYNIYFDYISNKSIPNKKSAYYIVVEYEKSRQIRYYVEITKKFENKMYTIYFKSYPPKKILNTKNKYIKE